MNRNPKVDRTWKESPDGAIYTADGSFVISLLPNALYRVDARAYGNLVRCFESLEDARRWCRC